MNAFEKQYGPIADNAARKYKLPTDLFRNQIRQESGFNPRALSPSNAQGIAQIIPKWHPTVDPYNVEAALDYAAKLMRTSWDKRGSYKLALMDYNWGPGNVNSWIKAGSNNDAIRGETKHYLDVVLGLKWPEPPKNGEPVTSPNQYRVGSGVLAKMQSLGDSPATDEIYFGGRPDEPNPNFGKVSISYGRSGNQYVYIFDTNETVVFLPSR